MLRTLKPEGLVQLTKLLTFNHDDTGFILNCVSVCVRFLLLSHFARGIKRIGKGGVHVDLNWQKTMCCILVHYIYKLCVNVIHYIIEALCVMVTKHHLPFFGSLCLTLKLCFSATLLCHAVR